MTVEGGADLALVQRLDELVELVEVLGTTAYVRVSAGPEADAGSPSTDGESGATLPGLSVNRLSPEPWWQRPVRQWVARQICQYVHLAGGERYPWVLTGREVGRGPDSEPLVTDVHPVARLAPPLVEEAVREYHAALDAGRMPG
ncbi:DUF6098 family protein [Cellulomonas hominis]|jgi:hypothetical protein|uniref:DUF6098 family protein n=1 Tax=Cellulomonas hominis TaxID=156981 RepID=UPI001B9F670A|nr:DUF6098 family protein [Cellulomonas hominis]VTR77453.1 hypothetical protein CHMI_02222 [Cellulomonas hominis]